MLRNADSNVTFNHKFPNAPLTLHALTASADVIPERIGNGDDATLKGTFSPFCEPRLSQGWRGTSCREPLQTTLFFSRRA